MHRNSTGLPRRRMAGMTLLELMIVCVVVGILGLIAIPSYRQYVMRSQRTEAKAALLRLQTNQERFYLANRIYSGDPVALGFTGGVSERGTYALEIVGADATTYLARATPRAGGAYDMRNDAQCATFTLDAQGVRGATGTAAATCW
jgi:type IV pilus assembly protein PilE